MTSTPGSKPRIGPYAGGTIVTPDIDKASAPYLQYLKYSERAAGTVSRAMAQSWGAPAMEGRRFRVLGSASGSSQFIRFVEGKALPSYRPMSTYGWNALEITVQDVDALPAHIVGSPFETLGEPRNLSSTDNIRAMQVRGLADEVLYLTQIKEAVDTERLPRAHAFVDHIFIVILGSSDFDASRAFYDSHFTVGLGNPFPARVRPLNKAFGLDIETKHQICTIALQSIDLGRRFKPRPLGCCIHPAIDHYHAGFLRRSETTLTQHRLVRPGEINVLHTTVFDAVKRARAAMGVINNLIGCSDDTGLHIGTDAAYRSDPDHRLDALRM